MFRSFPLLTTTAIILSLGSVPASAQEASLLSDIYACATLEIDAERLACYDAKVPVVKAMEDRNEFVTIDTEKAKEIKREAFGFSLPSLPKIFNGGNDTDDKEVLQEEELVEAVKSIRRGLKPLITLENGQVWQVIEGEIRRSMKGDMTIVIKPGAFSSYLATISSGPIKSKVLRVKRVE